MHPSPLHPHLDHQLVPTLDHPAPKRIAGALEVGIADEREAMAEIAKDTRPCLPCFWCRGRQCPDRLQHLLGCPPLERGEPCVQPDSRLPASRSKRGVCCLTQMAGGMREVKDTYGIGSMG